MSANAVGAGPAPTPLTQRAGRLIGRAGILIPFLIAFVVLAIISPPFLRFGNLTNILDQQAGIIIVACAGTFVLIAGGIDDSGMPIAGVELFDSSRGGFFAERSLNGRRDHHVAVPICDGTVLIVGGADTAEVYTEPAP